MGHIHGKCQVPWGTYTEPNTGIVFLRGKSVLPLLRAAYEHTVTVQTLRAKGFEIESIDDQDSFNLMRPHYAVMHSLADVPYLNSSAASSRVHKQARVSRSGSSLATKFPHLPTAPTAPTAAQHTHTAPTHRIRTACVCEGRAAHATDCGVCQRQLPRSNASHSRGPVGVAA